MSNPQFNLICHGMMLFQEQAAGFLILIPEIKEHSYMFGTPKPVNATNVTKGCSPISVLTELEISSTFPPPAIDYQLVGPTGQVVTNMLPGAVDPQACLMIDGSQVEVVAALKRIAISVPKPDLITQFRPLIPQPGMPSDPLNGMSPSLLIGGNAPASISDVIAFSYMTVLSGSVTFAGQTYAAPAGQTTNLCVYSQVILGDGEAMGPHRTGTNDLIHYNTHAHPTFDLSMIGNADTAPASPGLGIGICQLLSLTELNAVDNIEGGCAPTFVTQFPLT
jgi:hypothetical protein